MILQKSYWVKHNQEAEAILKNNVLENLPTRAKIGPISAASSLKRVNYQI